MFADVALHRRFPAKFDTFTYAIPEDISVELGQIVQVPFRNQKLAGVVRRIHADVPAYATKPLARASDLALTGRQLALANWMSEKYACPFSKAVDYFVPENVWPRLRHRSARAVASEPAIVALRPEVALPRNDIKIFVASLLSSPSKKLAIEKTPLPRREFYKTLLGKIPENSQALFLFPEIFSVNKFAEGCTKYYSGLTLSEQASVWHDVQNGKINCIAGTRAALFLPFENLSCIVFDFESSESYQELRAPYFHALEVAEKIAELWKIPLIVVSATPRVETWHGTETGGYEKHEWKSAETLPTVITVNMKDERSMGNYGIFAAMTTEKIASALSKDEQVLLFINRKGQANALFCRDCGNIFRCEKCAVPLTIHDNGVLQCSRCKQKKPIPSRCEKCGNVKLKSLGFGTERIESDIREVFGRAKILRLDREVLAGELDEKNLQAVDIVVATQIIDKPLSLPRLAVSIAVMPDALLHRPDFRASEEAFRLLTHLKNLTKNTGTLIIQTFMPDHSLFSFLEKNTPEAFYEDELATRKSLSLQPFNHP